ncbi:head protein [Burkholderia phage BcepB1A]|uniref:head protein n=1 Tax=Burkholderia phage BcepB1A TaxID=279530 RepID=UPI0000377990|nr:head protein [Burkholderia phage BcepB1A]AAT37725.1 gp19 [Burkholderia phage BcepB1A]
MSVPGLNLLAMALGLIASETVEYFAETGRTKQPNGVFIASYASPVPIEECSVQAVDRSKYTDLGLDFQKTYVTWFVPNQAFTTIKRGKAGDVLEWNGGRYQMNGGIDWTGQDSWGTATCVLIGPATGALTNG